MTNSKVFWSAILATPALLAASFMTAAPVKAADAPSPVATTADVLTTVPAAEATTRPLDMGTASLASNPGMTASAPIQLAQTVPAESVAPAAMLPSVLPSTEISAAVPSVSDLDQVIQYGNEGAAQAQVNSISQLSDVQPTDWAYTALQRLVEEYDCIEGYPDSTFKGSRALTRYEFAAGLNACLDRVSELIAKSTADLATKEDLATLQRLQEEFQAELATLRGRVDSLEARTAELEANQFSTTTKLQGQTIFAVGIPIDSDDSFDDETIAGYRIRLRFNTSFTGDDLLVARLQARDFGNLSSFAGSLGWKFSPAVTGDEVSLNKLYYRFPLGDRVSVTLGANGMSDTDWVASSISPFDNDAYMALTGLGNPAPYNFIPGSTGAGAIIQLTDALSFDFGYSATSASNPSPGSGLFNGDYGIVAQLTYLSDFVDAALTYSNGFRGNGFLSAFGAGIPEVANTYGGTVNFKFGDINLMATGAYTSMIAINSGSYDVWSYQAGLAFMDFGGEGNALGLLAGVTPYAAEIPGPDDDNTFAMEGFYRFKVNDNISVTPGLIWVTNPGNNSDTSDTLVGAIRTTFSF